MVANNKNQTPDIALDCNLVQGVVHLGEMNDDTSGVPFIWGKLLSRKPMDDEGNVVKNPGSIMIYAPTDLMTGSVKKVVLSKRSLGGLYDYVTPEDEAIALEALGLTRDQLPEIRVVEREIDETIDRKEKSKNATKSRRELAEARRNRELEIIKRGSEGVAEASEEKEEAAAS